MAVVLSLGITIAGIYQRETLLTTSSEASTHAFYAADTALECGMYHDRTGDFSTSTYASSIACANTAPSVVEVSSGVYSVTFDDTAGSDICARIIIYKGTDPETRLEARGRSTCAASNHPAERALRTAY